MLLEFNHLYSLTNHFVEWNISAIVYRIEQNFGGTKFWRNCDFETLAEKSLANPMLACIFIIYIV